MPWTATKDSVTVASRLARLPALAVTSYAFATPAAAPTATEAVVPATVKSAISTPVTGSLKVTRQIRVSALVGEFAGSWRTIEATVGGVVSEAQNGESVADRAAFVVARRYLHRNVPAFVGVPEKARVPESKDSQVGSAELLTLVAM